MASSSCSTDSLADTAMVDNSNERAIIIGTRESAVCVTYASFFFFFFFGFVVVVKRFRAHFFLSVYCLYLCRCFVCLFARISF
jgi:hypothetical protein